MRSAGEKKVDDRAESIVERKEGKTRYVGSHQRKHLSPNWTQSGDTGKPK